MSAVTEKPQPEAVEPEETPAVAPPEPDNPEADTDEVLNLATLTRPRKLVKLPTRARPQGEQYELRLIDDFGIEKQQKLLSWGRQFQKLMSSDKDLTDNEAERLKFLLNSVFHSILEPVPGGSGLDALEGVNDAVKNRVVQTFIWGPLLGQQEAQMEVIRRLVEKNLLTQEQVDEVRDEMRAEANQISET